MRLAMALVYTSLVCAVFASAEDCPPVIWTVLVAAVVVTFVAALFRVHAVVNSPNKEDS
ncbi:hypothetical protein NYQ35_15905 [Curtobacterium flaccumfaciens pv. flaccumfaciens]|uniref:hypothetical protein n=1 Tax=Curtobacterium flaccumfaciens TaxID=2035 RepID=UPI00217EC41F|nr:hypothetical protein [Curtobacterium flaccumfaciens]MCS6570290.1 hypothetical protein [Curtobacterium flaccumfaciens pv. flaccumfaciens]MCS6585146.1 hypothetical protein [Curtobacterium flaccumfaciens pv. flaccumfaciens]